MKFSVIVPVYNVERYLNTCVDSILDQSYQDMEILLINDGSTDTSGKLCDQYEQLDKRVKVFHKKNGGLSDARNFGLAEATGDYVLFIDSDDWIEHGCLAEFGRILEDNPVDVLVTRLTETFETERVQKDRHMGEYIKTPFTKKRAIEWIVNISETTWPAPKKIYSLKFIRENNLQFLKGFLHEDMDWTSNVLYHAGSYAAGTQ